MLLSRREALAASGVTLLTSFQLASTATTANAAAETTTTTSSSSSISIIDASWSGVDGLNSNDNNVVAFDASAYRAMKDDPTRTPIFQQAIIRQLGKDPESCTVLDLGTGPFALFAIIAAQAGAGKVYAIEADPQAAQSAIDTIQRAGYNDIITVLQGLSTEITLPEKVDVCIAEIVGSIATEEGAYATIVDAHERHVKNPTSPNAWIPNRIQTYAAPASYTLHNLFGPPEFDWDKLHDPVRFNCRDNGLELLADPVLLEDVAFYNIMDKNQQGMVKKPKELVFTIDKVRMDANVRPLYDEFRRGQSSPAESQRLATETAHSLSGIALWPRLVLSDDRDTDTADTVVCINSRSFPAGNAQRSHWQTVLPIMTSRPVSGLIGGETVVVTATFDLPTSVTQSPKYRLNGKVMRTVVQ